MVLEEDGKTNRMHESLNLFADVVNNQWFSNTSIILFLNKKDLFQAKIKKTNLNVCFPGYKGGLDFDKGSAYIEKQFLKKNKSEGTRHIYTHLTCATDTENIRVVFNAVQEIFLTTILSDYDML